MMWKRKLRKLGSRSRCILEFLKVFARESMRPYFQLYDLYTSYQDIPETKHLLHKINGDILSVEPRTSEIYEWLMNKSDSTDEDTIRKSLEIITEALSNMPTNAMLDICIGRVDTLLQQITASGRLTLLPQVLKFCSDVYSNEMWETCPSETYHISRIHFLKQIPNYIGLLETTSDSKTIEALESMYKNYPLRETAVRSLTKIPASFGLVKELVLLIISTEQKFTRAKQVLRYLSVVDWKSADKEDAGKFLNFVYFAFVTGNVKVQGKVMDLLNMRAPPGIDDLRVCHLKKEYLEGLYRKGRAFYKKFRFLTSSWSLACAVIEVETDYCVASGKSSDVLKDAIEDSMRLCGSSSIEPWISAILSHHRRKNEKTAKQLLRRALDTFSIENENRSSVPSCVKLPNNKVYQHSSVIVMAGSSSTGGVRWVPLESNPEVLTKYSRLLGAAAGEWVDVFALDEDSLEHIPKPVKAVILLFPISEGYDKFCKDKDESIKAEGQEVSKDLFYMKQYVGNACGTIGIMHSLGNNVDEVKLEDGSSLKEFILKTKDMTAEVRGEELEKFNRIASAHEEVASEGQTAPPAAEENLVTHFVAFVHKDGSLYELDGRRAGPVKLGPTTPDNLLKDAAVVCKQRMDLDPTEYRFTVVALTTGEV
ncbi:Ubiquitin carboxyl-terminal hydrolase isozyme L3 [Orchesella cincta]|uniref:Ubiquitin carboxyl-terminal hydrolase n=1 Tax=Orchesella cincta TaxID=48709 RepID=A0A1D2MEM4_ORCCI|nr:Ubiquitin carboxyl-terminal hydrolase isozyme L3 [Orchesella cincta]